MSIGYFDRELWSYRLVPQMAWGTGVTKIHSVLLGDGRRWPLIFCSDIMERVLKDVCSSVDKKRYVWWMGWSTCILDFIILDWLLMIRCNSCHYRNRMRKWMCFWKDNPFFEWSRKSLSGLQEYVAMTLIKIHTSVC